MLLPQTAEYALRAMAWLALQGEGAAVPGKELSTATGIPSHYLSKILRRMVVSGLLNSRKGHGGGFSLARPPAQITFCDILDAVDAAPTSGRCAFGWGRCDDANPCPLHHSWSRISSEFHHWAVTGTLADVVNLPDARLKRRLTDPG